MGVVNCLLVLVLNEVPIKSTSRAINKVVYFIYWILIVLFYVFIDIIN